MATLLERFGGEEIVEKFVDDFYDRMRRDQDIEKVFSKFGNFDRLKSRTVDYLVGEWGGTPYIGQDLFASHTQVNVTGKNFDYMMKCIGESLKLLKVQPKVRAEVVESIEAMREPITDPDERFKKWAMEKLAQLEKAAKEKQGEMVQTAMGFTISKEKFEQQQREQQKKDERLKKLAEMRKAREKPASQKKGTASSAASNAAESQPSPSSPSSPGSPSSPAAPAKQKRSEKRSQEGRSQPSSPGEQPGAMRHGAADETFIPGLVEPRPSMPGPDMASLVRARLAL